MSESEIKLKNRLLKLKSLAERGVGGEKETAKKKLEKLLKDNNLTESDLNEDQPFYYLFSYQGEAKKKLLSQCIYKILGPDKFTLYKSKRTRNKIGTYCTPAQKIEIDLDYQFYSALLDQEIMDLTEAFIAKQDIFPENTPTEIINNNSMSEKEFNHKMKIMNLSSNITKKSRPEGLIEQKESV